MHADLGEVHTLVADDPELVANRGDQMLVVANHLRGGRGKEGVSAGRGRGKKRAEARRV